MTKKNAEFIRRYLAQPQYDEYGQKLVWAEPEPDMTEERWATLTTEQQKAYQESCRLEQEAECREECEYYRAKAMAAAIRRKAKKGLDKAEAANGQ